MEEEPKAAAPAQSRASPAVSQRELEEERSFLRQVRRDLGKREVRFTIIGVSGVGKTAFLMTAESALRDRCTFVPPHLGVAGRHGNRWLIQRSFTTQLMAPDEEITIVSLDFKGIAMDGTERRSLDCIAEEARNIFCGIFPGHLLNLPDEARMTQETIEERPQDALLILFGADMLHVPTAEASLAAIANRLAEFHLPFFVVLTKIDLLPATATALDNAIDQLVALTGKHRAFIYPIANVTGDRKIPPIETTHQIYRLFSGILYHSRQIRPYVPSFRRVVGARVDEVAENIRQKRQDLVARVQPDLNKILWFVVVLLGLTVAYLVGSRK